MPRIVVVLCLTLMHLLTTAAGPSVRRVATPTGYNEYWAGAGAGGRDSLFHRVYDAAMIPARDTMYVFTIHDTTAYPIRADFTVVLIERLFLKQAITALVYDLWDERLTDHGWGALLFGPTRLWRVPKKEFIRAEYRDSLGVIHALTPRPPD